MLNQNNLEQAVDPRPVAMCQFSEYLCDLKNIRVSGNCAPPVLDQSVWRHLGMNKSSLVEIMSMINDEVDNARNLLQVAKN